MPTNETCDCCGGDIGSDGGYERDGFIFCSVTCEEYYEDGRGDVYDGA